MSKFYTYAKWVETFKPITNSLRKYEDTAFETYGEEVEFVQAQEPNKIWTEVDGEGGCYITSGYHFINRVQYYITEIPWEDEDTEVPTWAYRQCDCMERVVDGILEYCDDPDPNCKECEEGNIDIPTDTREDLIAIYGEEAEIIG